MQTKLEKMKTREQAEARALELFPDEYFNDCLITDRSDLRKAFLKCWEEMQEKKLGHSDQVNDQVKEQPKGRVDVEAKLYGILLKFRDSEEASVGSPVREILKLITTFQDNGLREAAEKVVKKWKDNCAITAQDIEKIEKALK